MWSLLKSVIWAKHLHFNTVLCFFLCTSLHCFHGNWISKCLDSNFLLNQQKMYFPKIAKRYKPVCIYFNTLLLNLNKLNCKRGLKAKIWITLKKMFTRRFREQKTNDLFLSSRNVSHNCEFFVKRFYAYVQNLFFAHTSCTL